MARDFTLSLTDGETEALGDKSTPPVHSPPEASLFPALPSSVAPFPLQAALGGAHTLCT